MKSVKPMGNYGMDLGTEGELASYSCWNNDTKRLQHRLTVLTLLGVRSSKWDPLGRSLGVGKSVFLWEALEENSFLAFSHF